MPGFKRITILLKEDVISVKERKDIINMCSFPVCKIYPVVRDVEIFNTEGCANADSFEDMLILRKNKKAVRNLIKEFKLNSDKYKDIKIKNVTIYLHNSLINNEFYFINGTCFNIHSKHLANKHLRKEYKWRETNT